MAGTITTSYGTNGQAITVTLASLASGSARASTAISNTSTLYTDTLVSIKVKTASGAPAGQKSVNIYAYATTDGGTTYTEGATGTDAAITLTSPTNAIFIGSISCPAASTTYAGGPWSIATAFGGTLPAGWGIIVENQTGVALDSTEGNMTKTYQGVSGAYT